MTAQHTPGPWNLGWSGLGIQVISDGEKPRKRTVDGKTKVYPVATIGQGFDDSEDAANARLIIAAPDLLAACEEAATSLDRELGGYALEFREIDYGSVRNAYKRLKTAIHKATWEQSANPESPTGMAEADCVSNDWPNGVFPDDAEAVSSKILQIAARLEGYQFRVSTTPKIDAKGDVQYWRASVTFSDKGKSEEISESSEKLLDAATVVLARLNAVLDRDKIPAEAPITEDWFRKAVGRGNVEVSVADRAIRFCKQEGGHNIVMLYLVVEYVHDDGCRNEFYREVLALETVGAVRDMCRMLRIELQE